MIKAIFEYKNNKCFYFSISGHAGSKESEKLVCSGVSSIVFGIINSLNILKAKTRINVLENNVIIKVINDSKDIQLIFQVLYISLKTIENKYNNKIQIVRSTNEN